MQYMPPPDPQTYHEQVWQIARQVPSGFVVTYGQIAQIIVPPADIDPEAYKAFSPRWVGEAMAACPADVPWQRVINSQGKISQRPGAEQQRQWLEAEGVLFQKDKIDLKIYQWQGSNHQDRPRQPRLL